MKESTKEKLRVIGKIVSHPLSIAGWAIMVKLIAKAKFYYDKDDSRYGHVLINFDRYGEMNIEFVVFVAILLFLIGYSIYDIRRFFKKEIY